MVNNDPSADQARILDRALVKLIVRGRRWYEQLTSGESSSVREIAKAEDLDERYVARILYSSLRARTSSRRSFRAGNPFDSW